MAFFMSPNRCPAHKHIKQESVATGENMERDRFQFFDEVQKFSATELRRRYPAEANSHRNMLQRAQTRNRVIHPEFREFRRFLAHVGPRPCKGATLDRIDNNDPEYGPGKVRWADKRTQNNNKGDTLLFHYSRTGETYTVSRLAKLQRVKPSTIRKRKERGWTDDQIIEGKTGIPQRPRAFYVENPGPQSRIVRKRS
jgi:hypothetical protein